MSTSYNTINKALIYTALMSEICEFVDTCGGVNVAFGNIFVELDDNLSQEVCADEYVCMVDMKTISQLLARSIDDKDMDTQKSILDYINKHL